MGGEIEYQPCPHPNYHLTASCGSVSPTTSFSTAGRGAWPADHDRHPVAVIEPPATPMYRQVAAYLETKPSPPEGNPKRADEARAAVAVCLRWGSYFAVLADPARPPSPHIDDEQVSRIDDGEMARMNVEILGGVGVVVRLVRGERPTVL